MPILTSVGYNSKYGISLSKHLNVVTYKSHPLNSLVYLNRETCHLCLNVCVFLEAFDRFCFALVVVGRTERTQSTISKIGEIKLFFWQDDSSLRCFLRSTTDRCKLGFWMNKTTGCVAFASSSALGLNALPGNQQRRNSSVETTHCGVQLADHPRIISL